ncbi:MAG: CopD family protein [Nannocystaceae bacterium]|nr:CopD family protein [Nannocystaceae bacterium]
MDPTVYATAKAVHIVGFISWFAGLFYIVRLFIYHAEASERPPAERDVLLPQLELMAGRLWKIITVPASLLTFGAGLTMVLGGWPFGSWLHWKFVWLALLVAYHLTCGWIRQRQLARALDWSSNRLRMFNEVATMLMVAIVFTAVFKVAMTAAYGVAGLLGLGLSLMFGLRAYRKVRERPKAASASRASEPPGPA